MPSGSVGSAHMASSRVPPRSPSRSSTERKSKRRPQAGVFVSSSSSFSDKKWEKKATTALLRATESVDKLCHSIVHAKQLTRPDVASEVRDLAVTVAVIERFMFAYAQRVSRMRARNHASKVANVVRHNSGANFNHLLAPGGPGTPGGGVGRQPHSQPQSPAHRAPTPNTRPPRSIAITVPSRGVFDAISAQPLPPHPVRVANYTQQPTSANADSRLRSRSRDSSEEMLPPASLLRAQTMAPGYPSHQHQYPPPLPPSAITSSNGVTVHEYPTPPHSPFEQPLSASKQPPPQRFSPQLTSMAQSIASIATVSSLDLPRASPHMSPNAQPQQQPPSPSPLLTVVPNTPPGVDQFARGIRSPVHAGMPTVNGVPVLAMTPTIANGNSSATPTAFIQPHHPNSTGSLFGAAYSAGSAAAGPAWHHPGGVVTLLQLITRTLNATRESLDTVRESSIYSFSFFSSVVLNRYTLSLPFLYLTRNIIARYLERIVVTLLSFKSINQSRLVSVLASLWHGVQSALASPTTSVPAAVGGYTASVPASLAAVSAVARGVRASAASASSSATSSAVISSTAVWYSSPLVLILLARLVVTLHEQMVSVRLHHLKQLHRRLLFLCRLWHICISVLDDQDQPAALQLARQVAGTPLSTTSSSSPSAASSAAAPGTPTTTASGGAGAMPIARWMLELVPPSLDSSFWYHSNWRLSMMKYGLDVLYSSVSLWYSVFGLNIAGVPFTVLAAMYYAARPRAAAAQASKLFASPDMRLVTAVWSVMDSPICRRISKKFMHKLLVFKELELTDRVVSADFEFGGDEDNSSSFGSTGNLSTMSSHPPSTPAAPTAMTAANAVTGSPLEDNINHNIHQARTRASLLARRGGPSTASSVGGGGGEMSWLSDVTIPPRRNATDPVPSTTSTANPTSATAAASLSAAHPATGSVFPQFPAPLVRRASLGKQNEKPIHVKLLSAVPLPYSINTKLHRVSSSSVLFNPTNSKLPSAQPRPLLIYFHGGGWVTSFWASDMQFLSELAVKTEVPILYVDYSLAPENAYPTALNEGVAVYKWVLAGRLGFHPSKIILAGDSAGGHLAVGTCIRSITDPENIRRPDGLVLAYPTLNIGPSTSSSKAIFMMDVIAPMNLLKQCTSVYLPSHLDWDADPCISPLLARDELLSQFPPTSIMCGGFDPFLDDSVNFAHRLYAAGVSCRLEVFSTLPHHFLNFVPLLTDAKEAVQLAGQWICRLARTKPSAVAQNGTAVERDKRR